MRIQTMVSLTIIGLLAIGALPPTPAIASNALTVQTRLQTGSDHDLGQVVLGGLAAGDDGKAVISLVWLEDSSTFLPVWRLALLSELGVVGDEGRRAIGTVTGASLLPLALASPEAERVYLTTLSFAADTGDLAIAVRDESTGSNVYSDSLRLHPHSGLLYPLVLQDGDGGRGNSLEVVASERVFVPLTVRWGLSQLGLEGDGAPALVTSRLTQQHPTVLHVENSFGYLPGSLHLVAERDGSAVSIARFPLSEVSPMSCDVSTSPLAPGEWLLHLYYEVNASRWLLDSHTLSISNGVLFAHIDSLAWLDPLGEARTLHGTLRLWTEGGSLPGLSVGLLISDDSELGWLPANVDPSVVDVSASPILVAFTVEPQALADGRASFRVVIDDGLGWTIMPTNLSNYALPPLGRLDAVVFQADPSFKPTYRIPAIVQALNGDLLAFAEKRKHGRSDVGHIDLVVKRSTDRGTSWGDEVVLYDAGAYESHADPTPFVDPDTGRIWLFFLRDKKNYHVMASDDNGHTWSEARSIHAQVTRSEWNPLLRFGVGPGAGVVKLQQGPKAGRIVVPARHREIIDGRATHVANVFFSDDDGATWEIGGNAIVCGNENQLVELADGRLLMNSRDGDENTPPGTIVRRIATSLDGGESWLPAYRDEQLVSPGVQASIARLTLEGRQDRNRLVFVNPNSSLGRTNVSVRISYDEGETWTEGKTIYPFASAYSDIVPLDDGSIGVLYERGPAGSNTYWAQIAFARFSVDWVTNGED